VTWSTTPAYEAPAAGRDEEGVGADAAEAVGPTAEDADHPMIDPVSSNAAAAAVAPPAHARPPPR